MGNRSKLVNGILRKKQGHDKYLCVTCLKSGKGTNPCGVEGHSVSRISHVIRVPSFSASKTKWKEFTKIFGPYIIDEDKIAEYEETLKKLKGINSGNKTSNSN